VADSPLFAHPVHNLIVSNVAGPQAQLYFLGCEVEAMYPGAQLNYGKLTRTSCLRNLRTPRRADASGLPSVYAWTMADHDRAAARREITDALIAALDRRHEQKRCGVAAGAADRERRCRAQGSNGPRDIQGQSRRS
jgi:hypothetical protein